MNQMLPAVYYERLNGYHKFQLNTNGEFELENENCPSSASVDAYTVTDAAYTTITTIIILLCAIDRTQNASKAKNQ